MVRNRGPHGAGELAVVAGTSGEAPRVGAASGVIVPFFLSALTLTVPEACNHVHLGWLVASERARWPYDIPPVLSITETAVPRDAGSTS